jgi:hypothetical protein
MRNIPERLHFEMPRADAALLVIIGLGLVLRLIYFTGLAFADDPDYAKRAFDLLHGHGHLYRDNNGLRIGTWYPAAIGYALFGVSHLGLVIYPLVMSVLAIWVVGRLGTRVFDRRTGLTAALLWAIYPLDVELATRLLPDALLAAFSVIAMYFLFCADMAQTHDGVARLRRPWRYIASGAVLGWCTAVNMSSVVLLVFVAAYLPLSTWFLRRRDRSVPLARWIAKVALRRVLLVAAGFFTIVLLEALLYRLEFGSLFAKYAGTLSHYNEEGRSFFRDRWFYPQQMFFLSRQWRVHVPPAAFRPYGFYFVVALPSLIYGVIRGGAWFRAVALWALTTFAYLQWGSMSLTSWNFMHRLDRHLELVTPPMILVIAFALTHLARRKFGRVVAVTAFAWLAVTSLWTIHTRHAETRRQLSLMQPVHSVLEVFHPTRVYMDTQTTAYQRFLDRYEDRGREYHDLERAVPEPGDGTMVIIHSENPYRTLPGGVDPQAPPANWRLLTLMHVPDGRGAVRTIRAYQINR